MTRRHLTFACHGETLLGTLDEAAGKTGLLIVSGGNEIRCGAFGGQAQLAARIAGAGFPVFRFDRRGVGDSGGENRGFRGSRDDILAALEAFRGACPQLDRIIAFGNCDAASALMLMHGEGCDALLLSNPWTFDDAAGDDALPPPAAIRARYWAKLRNPAEWLRLAKGEVDLSRLWRGLSAASKAAACSPLMVEMTAGLAASNTPYRILVAGNDRTGQAFAAAWHDSEEIHRCPGASHAYVEPHARAWLEAQVLEMLRG